MKVEVEKCCLLIWEDPINTAETKPQGLGPERKFQSGADLNGREPERKGGQ